MIPLPRLHFPPSPLSPLHRAARDSIPVGSYNPSEFASSTAFEFIEGAQSPNRAVRRSNSGKFASSLPSGRFNTSGVKQNNFPASSLTTVSVGNMPPGIKDKYEGASVVEAQNHLSGVGTKPLKEKITMAERRALQEAQRSAKTAAKGDASKTPAAASGVAASANINAGKAAKAPLQGKESSPVVASEKRGGDRRER